MHIRTYIGSDYDKVGKRQKERKQKEMKDKMMNYTSNVYSDTGLVPTNFILKSPVSGTVVDLPLCPSVPELQELPVVEEKLMKQHTW